PARSWTRAGGSRRHRSPVPAEPARRRPVSPSWRVQAAAVAPALSRPAQAQVVAATRALAQVGAAPRKARRRPEVERMTGPAATRSRQLAGAPADRRRLAGSPGPA